MDENIIIEFLQKKLNDQERQQFITWLREDRSHFELFASVKKAWALSAVNSDDDLDAAIEFKRFKYRHLDTKKIPTNRTVFPVVKVLKIAAIFVFAFIASFYTYTVVFKRGVQLNGFNEITTKAGEKTHITLADGSQVWINACTKFRYPASLHEKELDFYLEGEAYFDFKKIPERTITVHTSSLNIKVLGTAFNLKSYSDENVIETTLVRGQIAIEESLDEKNSCQPILLKPSQSATYFKNNGKFNIKKLTEQRIVKSETFEELAQIANTKQSNLIIEEQIDIEPPTSWKDGKLVFRKESFESLSKMLERWYDVKILIMDNKLKKARFSGTFDKETVEQALKALSYPVPFDFKIKKDSIFLMQK